MVTSCACNRLSLVCVLSGVETVAQYTQEQAVSFRVNRSLTKLSKLHVKFIR